jgi:hypothetical protein
MSRSIWRLVKVVHNSRWSPSAKRYAVNGRPGRGRYNVSRSCSVRPSGKTEDIVRNMPAYAELAPCAR